MASNQASGIRQYLPRMAALGRQSSEGSLRPPSASQLGPGAGPGASAAEASSASPTRAASARSHSVQPTPCGGDGPPSNLREDPVAAAFNQRPVSPSWDFSPAPLPIVGGQLLTEFPKVVNLNVGGHRYMTTIGTLRADPNSMLGRMFSGQHPVLRDDDGSFVIDRDGRHFHHVLNYLRDGSVPIGLLRVDRLELLREVDFYNLRGLYSIIAGPTVNAAMMSGGGGGAWLHGLIQDLARAEAADFSASTHSHRVYARLRYGQEYSGDWIVSSPRNLPNVEYELYDACLARDPITALNKMGAAGFRPCVDPPVVPPSTQCHSDSWDIMMYKDVWQ